MLKQEDRIRSKKDLKEWLACERQPYKIHGIERIFPLGETALLYRHITLLRKTEYYLNTKNRILYKLFRARLRMFQVKYSLSIPLNCCGKGLRIMHLGPVLLNNRVTVGQNVKLHVNSAIVAGGSNDDTPTIGNNVVFGYGAVALGKIHISDGVAIGANAVVNKDILEENVCVAGVPARIVSHNGSSTWGNHGLVERKDK